MNADEGLIECLFHEAKLLASPEERAEFLQKRCGDEPKLRKRVEDLLVAHFQTGTFLGPNAGSVPAVLCYADEFVSLTEKSGDRIGRYKLLELVGEGGFGRVWMAEQEDPVRRRVALKIITLGLNTREVVARFDAERQALAMMDHPGIAKVFDGGATETGRPYFVMELVRGAPLTKYCDDKKLNTRDRLQLFVQVCQAVQHAHQKGIIHRDLKPSNILVTELDGKAVPKVIDFGVAKATEARLTERTLFTRLGQMIGTPPYMSPEQVSQGGLDIDTRSDIYSLGAVLYELLTGRTPFETKRLLEAGYEAILKTIREVEPPKPSTRLSTMLATDRADVAKLRQCDAPKLIHLLKGDLDWIVMRAMEKDRARRYDTASGFATDLNRHLNNEPVLARRPSNLYRFQKMVRRNRMSFFTASAVTIAVLFAIVMGLAMVQQRARQTEANRQVSQRRRLLEEMQLTRLIARSDGWRTQIWSRASEAAKIRTSLSNGDVRDQAAACLIGLDADREKEFPCVGSSVIFDRGGKRLLIGGVSTESVKEPAKLWDSTAGMLQSNSTQFGFWPVAFFENETPAQLLYYTNRHSLVLSGVPNLQMIREWNIPSRVGETELKNQAFEIAHITPDGSSFVAVFAGSDGSHVLAVSKSTNLYFLGAFSTPLDQAAISTDGSLVAVVESNGKLGVWSVPDRTRIATLQASRSSVQCLALKQVRRVAERNDGQADDPWLLAAGDSGGTVTIWDVRTQTVKAFCRGGEYDVSAIAFSPDGTILASGGRAPVKLWDVATGKHLLDISTGNYLSGLAFSPDGTRLAASSLGDHVSIWRLDFGQSIQTLRGLSAQVSKVCFSADHSKLAALSHNWEMGLWDLASGHLLRIIETPRGLLADNAALSFSQDGKQLAFSTLREAKLWIVNSGCEAGSWQLPPGLGDCLAFDHSGNLFLFREETSDPAVAPFDNDPAKYPRICKIRKLTGPDPLKPLQEISEFNWGLYSAVAAPDGSWFVAEGIHHTRDRTNRTIRAFNSLTGQEMWSMHSDKRQPWGSLLADPSGNILVVHTNDVTLRTCLEMPSGRPMSTLNGEVAALAPKGDHYWISLGSPSSSERGWSLFSQGTDKALVALGIDFRIEALFPQFSATGELLAWGNGDGTVSVCHLKEVRQLLGSEGLGW